MRNPPTGLGYYVRGRPEDDVRWALAAGASWLAFQPNDTAWLDDHRPVGVQVWFYALEGSWRPSTWRGTLAKLQRLADRHAGAGIIADPEAADAWRAAGLGEVVELRRELVKVAEHMPVIVTTFPSWPFAAELAHPRLIASPQLYLHARPDGTPDRSESAPTVVPRFLDKWRRMGWRDVIPSVSVGTQYRGAERTPEQQRAYLEAFGNVRSAILWSQKLSPPRDPALLEVHRRWLRPPFC